MKKFLKTIALTFCLGSTVAMSGCAKENKYTRVGVLKTADSMNLYLTSVAKGNISSTYVYLGEPNSVLDYAKQIANKMGKSRPDCDIAYFPVESFTTKAEQEKTGLYYMFKESSVKDQISIAYFDTFHRSTDKGEEKLDEITGVWVARNGWMNTSSTAKNFIAGLAKTAEYRNKITDTKHTDKSNKDLYLTCEGKSFTTFGDLYQYVADNQKSLPEFDFDNYTKCYEQTAMFAVQNPTYFKDDTLKYFKKSSSDNGADPYIGATTAMEYFGDSEDHKTKAEIPDKGKLLVETLLDKIGLDASASQDKINIAKMQYGNHHAQDADPEKKVDTTKVIIISVVGGTLIVGVIVFLIIRRVKTGKKLFDVKKALDVDIDPEDPKIIKIHEVASAIKKIREDLNISLEDAAKALKIPAKYLANGLETGEFKISNKVQKRMIAFYKLPEDYFEKAYKVEK